MKFIQVLTDISCKEIVEIVVLYKIINWFYISKPVCALAIRIPNIYYSKLFVHCDLKSILKMYTVKSIVIEGSIN